MNHVARHPRKFLSAFTTLLFLQFLVQFHHYSITYVNSSFLGQFLSPEAVSLVYVVASLIVVASLFAAPRIVAWAGVLPLFIIAVPVLQLSVFFLGFSQNAFSAMTFFTLQGVLIFFLRYLLDLYVESISKDESQTGNTRSLFITAGNIGIFLGPLVASVIVIGSLFSPLYAAAAILLTPVFFIALGPLRAIIPHPPRSTNTWESVKNVFKCKPNLRRVMVVHFLMQLFSAMVVIYAPLYLFENGNLSWQAIGTLTALALLPYLFLEIPLGFLADRFIGEKEIMLAGLLIMAGTMVLLSFTPLSLFLLWGVWFVAVRIGAAMVEISTESYFFKQVNEEDASLISTFRILLPFAGVVAPLIALAALPFVGLQYLFAIFGSIFLLGIPFALRLVDTR